MTEATVQAQPSTKPAVASTWFVIIDRNLEESRRLKRSPFRSLDEVRGYLRRKLAGPAFADAYLVNHIVSVFEYESRSKARDAMNSHAYDYTGVRHNAAGFIREVPASEWWPKYN